MSNHTKTLQPFTPEYHESEVRSINIKPRTFRNIELKVETISGRVDGYMYRNFLTGFNDVPILFIDNKLWMSITPMEIDSHYMPIQLAEGKVGVGGLGLGYYVQRILEKDNVEEIIVYESNQDVIDFYLENFGNHEKITFKNKDVRTIEGEYFDFFYNDIYPEQLDLTAIEDMALLTGKNDITTYHFWTFEQMILEMINEGHKDDLPLMWKQIYFPFIQKLMNSPYDGLINLAGIGDEIYDKCIDYRLL